MAYRVKAQQPLVSVIVPAYNVERYIRKCVESIQQQSVEEIEIIVVNDGSTDATGEILDELSQYDERLYVIHKSNAGVSAARNSGLDVARGKYIVFVDGDDYLSPDFMEYMIELTAHHGSEFCFSLNYYTKQNEKQIAEDRIELLDNASATALLLSFRVIASCCNKIYSREFLTRCNLRFRTDLYYGEGMHFITAVSQRVNHVTVGRRKEYFYRRNNQNSVTTVFNIESLLNGEKAINLIEEQMIVNSENVRHMMLFYRSMYNVCALVRVKANRKEKEYKTDYERWLKYDRSNIGRIIGYKDISVYHKAIISGVCISPWIMSKLDIVRRKRIAEKSIEL